MNLRGAAKKASNQEITSLYIEHKSCKKVAEILEMSPQSVWERLKRMKLNSPINILTEDEKFLIQDIYEKGFIRGDGQLQQLAKDIGRTPQFISRYANSLKLTNKRRVVSEELKKENSVRLKNWHQSNEHPKGMLGKKHKPEVAKLVGERQKEWSKKATLKEKNQRYEKMVNTNRKNGGYDKTRGAWKSAWRTIGEKTKFFRSRWEANYARYLELRKQNGEIKDWLHEPETFWFKDILRGTRSYLPDFKIIQNDDTHYWVEVKGQMDARSKTKLKRFKKYYPEERLELVDGKWFKEHFETISPLIPDWEYGRTF